MSPSVFGSAGFPGIIPLLTAGPSTMSQLVSQAKGKGKGKGIYADSAVLEVNVGLERKLSLLLGGVIQVMFVIGASPCPILCPSWRPWN